MTDARIPACWTWPVTADHLDRAFEASRNDPGRDAKLALVWDWQDRRCGICGSCRKRLVNDHDHDTGYYRGWLCDSCNNQEGHAFENPLFARYRFRHPAAILGVRAYWVKPDSRRIILAELGPDPAEALQRHQEARDPGRRR